MHPEQPTNDLKGLAAEMLAYTVGSLFPNVLFLGSGTLKHGFYCDFIFEQPLYTEMLPLIDTHLRSSLKETPEVQIKSMMRENGAAFFQHHQQPYLAEIASQEASNVIDLVQIGDHYGFCLSTLLDSSLIGGAKVIEMEEVFLEGDLKVTRLVGAAFSDPQSLKQFVKAYNNLLKRKDHRVLGPKLDLFVFDPAVSTIEPVWLPKGTLLKKLLMDWLESKQSKIAYQKVETPLVISDSFFENQNEYLIEHQEAALSTTHLPQHIHLQKHLKQPLFEYAKVYQQVPEPEKWGLFNNNSYLSDLLTFRCSKKEVIGKIISSLQFIEETIRIFGFEAHWYLIASKQRTPKAKKEKQALETFHEAISHFSFCYPYISGTQEEENLIGPRLELRLVDEIGREWPSAAITLVVQESADDIILARTFWGSLDRFIALLIERHEELCLEELKTLLINEEKVN